LWLIYPNWKSKARILFPEKNISTAIMQAIPNMAETA